MTIKVLSFDFDGCLSHSAHVYAPNRNIIKDNQFFLDKIKSENQEFPKVYTFIGSTRQSFEDERLNGRNNQFTLCFPTIKVVNDYIGATLDTFLLADIFGNLEAGTSYSRAVDVINGQPLSDWIFAIPNADSHAQWLYDESKVTIMYAQMHKIANENPNEEIIFNFYDDRSDILKYISDFYTIFSNLIPTNVTLRLDQYAGRGEVTPTAEVKGAGFIDENYRQTVKDLSDQAKTSDNDGGRVALNVALNAKPQELQNRKARSTGLLVEAQVTTAQLEQHDFIPTEVPVALDVPNHQLFFSAKVNTDSSNKLITLPTGPTI